VETKIDAAGAVHVSELSVPLSDFASNQANAEFLRQWQEPRPFLKEFETGDIAKLRRLWDEQETFPALERARALFPVRIETARIGGIAADIVTPADGVSPDNSSHVLINLHGGGFIAGGGARALLEAIPIASVGKIKVVTLDYRLAPEHVFPAASEDIAAAYRALLEDHAAENIGLYGCSAGGTLAAQAIAWFDRHNLPQPGAIAMICSNASRMGAGDSIVLGRAFGISVPMPRNMRWYFDGTDAADPLVSPCASSDLMKRFPPSLLISASRDFFLSHTTYFHRRLVDAGAQSDLHVWDGLWHGFVWTPDLPESHEAFRLVSRFFAGHLGKRL
jgi:acetyl esterase/lipase